MYVPHRIWYVSYRPPALSARLTDLESAGDGGGGQTEASDRRGENAVLLPHLLLGAGNCKWDKRRREIPVDTVSAAVV